MFTEAAFLLHPEFKSRAKGHCRPGKQFETFMAMQGLDPDRLDASALRDAAESCSQCACRKACREWLRTGSFAYPGDPRCPNAGLLHH